MNSIRNAGWLVATSLALALPATSLSAAPTTGTSRAATGKVVVLSPLSFIRVDDLLFGTAVIPSAGTGTITINPLGGAPIYSNIVAIPSSLVQRGLFKGGGTIGEHATISGTLPTKLHLDGLLTNPSVDIEIEFDHARHPVDQTWDYVIDTTHTYDIWVGGTLTVPAGTKGGTYSNKMEITAEYP